MSVIVEGTAGNRCDADNAPPPAATSVDVSQMGPTPTPGRFSSVVWPVIRGSRVGGRVKSTSLHQGGPCRTEASLWIRAPSAVLLGMWGAGGKEQGAARTPLRRAWRGLDPLSAAVGGEDRAEGRRRRGLSRGLAAAEWTRGPHVPRNGTFSASARSWCWGSALTAL